MEEIVLSVKNISKSYKNNLLARQVSFDVSSGEIFGLIGPIESGKSSIIRMITGLSSPSAGKIDICGNSLITDYEEAMKFVGASLENSSVYLNMTGYQNLKYYASLHTHSPNTKQRINSLANFVEINDDLNDLAKNYNEDSIQKLSIAQALLHYPKLLILDEPTKGLDKNSLKTMRTFLKKVIKKYNIGVLIGSNNLSDMEVLCDRVGIVSGGEILDIKTVDEIKQGVKIGQKVAFKVNYPNFGAKLIKEKYKYNPYSVGSEIILQLPENKIQDIATFLSINGVAIFGLRTITKTLEEVFDEIIEKLKQEKFQNQ